ncbi:MAG: M48 metallopeptidase family protein [Minisyncoccia bacterium]
MRRLTRRSSRKRHASARERARTLAEVRLAHYAPIYGVFFGRIFIRDQKTRWGSCSSKGNLNFNWRIATLPPMLVDYVVVHELCHLIEFNHSPKFWALVGRTVPTYKEARKHLRAIPLR